MKIEHTQLTHLHIHGLCHASYAALDIREIQSALIHMLGYLGHGDVCLIMSNEDNLRVQRGEGFFESLSRGHYSCVATHKNADTKLPTGEMADSMDCTRTDCTGASCPPHNTSLSINFVRDIAIYAANIAQMDCASPTNILSFPLDAPATEGKLTPPIGDMLISVDTVRREAFLYGQDSNEYAISLLAHGMAHMVGYDHGEAMTQLEQALLTSLCD